MKLKSFRIWHFTPFGVGVETIKAEGKKDARARFKKKRKFAISSVEQL